GDQNEQRSRRDKSPWSRSGGAHQSIAASTGAVALLHPKIFLLPRGTNARFRADGQTSARSSNPMAPRRRPSHPLADDAGFGRSGRARRRARAEQGRAPRLGRPPAGQAGSRRHLGGRTGTTSRSLLAKV